MGDVVCPMVRTPVGIAGESVWMLLSRGDRSIQGWEWGSEGAQIFAADCGANQPAQGYKMLLESGPTSLPRLQTALRWTASRRNVLAINLIIIIHNHSPISCVFLRAFSCACLRAFSATGCSKSYFVAVRRQKL